MRKRRETAESIVRAFAQRVLPAFCSDHERQLFEAWATVDLAALAAALNREASRRVLSREQRALWMKFARVADDLVAQAEAGKLRWFVSGRDGFEEFWARRREDFLHRLHDNSRQTCGLQGLVNLVSSGMLVDVTGVRIPRSLSDLEVAALCMVCGAPALRGLSLREARETIKPYRKRGCARTARQCAAIEAHLLKLSQRRLEDLRAFCAQRDREGGQK